MEQLKKALHGAWDRCSRLRADTQTTAFRVLDGTDPLLTGLVVDYLSGVWVFHLYEGEWSQESGVLEALANFAVESLGAVAVYPKVFYVDRSRQTAGDETRDPIPLAGKTVPEVWEVRESELRFGLRPYDGYSVGLFLDQRNHRKFLGELSSGKRVLNGFCYTGGFSVFCAKADAMVTSVDVSKKAIEWTKSNFSRNGLNVEGHRFYVQDMREFFGRAIRQGEFFDLIILDPPSFARNRIGKPFSIQKEYEALVESSKNCLAPGGYFYFSTNCEKWSETQWQENVERAFGFCERVTLPSFPVDFENPEKRSRCVLLRNI